MFREPRIWRSWDFGKVTLIDVISELDWRSLTHFSIRYSKFVCRGLYSLHFSSTVAVKWSTCWKSRLSSYFFYYYFCLIKLGCIFQPFNINLILAYEFLQFLWIQTVRSMFTSVILETSEDSIRKRDWTIPLFPGEDTFTINPRRKEEQHSSVEFIRKLPRKLLEITFNDRASINAPSLATVVFRPVLWG